MPEEIVVELKEKNNADLYVDENREPQFDYECCGCGAIEQMNEEHLVFDCKVCDPVKKMHQVAPVSTETKEPLNPEPTEDEYSDGWVDEKPDAEQVICQKKSCGMVVPKKETIYECIGCKSTIKIKGEDEEQKSLYFPKKEPEAKPIDNTLKIGVESVLRFLSIDMGIVFNHDTCNKMLAKKSPSKRLLIINELMPEVYGWICNKADALNPFDLPDIGADTASISDDADNKGTDSISDDADNKGTDDETQNS